MVRRSIDGPSFGSDRQTFTKTGITFTRMSDFNNVGGYGKLIQLYICGYVMGHLILFVVTVMIN